MGIRPVFRDELVGFREGITFLGLVKLKGTQLKKQKPSFKCLTANRCRKTWSCHSSVKSDLFEWPYSEWTQSFTSLYVGNTAQLSTSSTSELLPKELGWTIVTYRDVSRGITPTDSFLGFGGIIDHSKYIERLH